MNTRALIINADDLGYDPAVTRGILRSMREGVVSSATFMVNTPYSEAAAREAHGLHIGLHLNLARGEPVWPGFPREFLEKGAFAEPRAATLPTEAVVHEVRAQLERLASMLGRPATHVDVHKHLHLHPNVLAGLAQVAREQGLPVRSINEPMRRELQAQGVATNAHFIGDAGAEAYWTLERFESAMATLPVSGVIELMCHPGYTPEAVKSGYSAQREVELSTFVHPKAREALARAGITPTGFGVLTSGR
ncbi:carbohydrate deacetylase [Hyalangium minutum]|uniref:Cellobiose phosphotransferase system YdjC-like protein n=1 Tax=Hyalangium minutum TaxID=394096 RepID=A0A085W513_9BACT|nr:ChbG/HpnK family deacetylase [Hyalangium minutum]KFE62776.1 Cellobiose phosphotransferase system YdjC-like protein [Hyalangium minutum]